MNLFLFLFLMSFFLMLLSDSVFQMVCMLLCGIIVLSLTVGLMVSKWMFSAVMLVFVGGMMTIFFYCLSLSKTPKLKSDFKSQLPVGVLLLLVSYDEPYSFYNLVSAIYNFGEMFSILPLTGYLLMSLFICVKLIEHFKGALQKMF